MPAREGIALLCDADGLILRVLWDNLGLGEAAGRSLSDLVDTASAGKVQHLLAQLKARSAIFGWELNVPLGQTIEALSFAGGAAFDHLVIVAAKSDVEAARLYEGLAGLVNEQAGALRALQKENALLAKRQETADSYLLEDLSRLNNELANAQRELAQKNVQLESLNAAEKRHARENEALAEAVGVLLTTLDLEALVERIRAAVLRAVPKADDALLILGADKVPGCLTAIVRERRPLVLPRVEEADLQGCRDLIGGAGPVRSAVALPLQFGEQVLGVMMLTAGEYSSFSEGDLHLLEPFAAAVTAALRNVQLHADVTRLATTDGLTGLLNRRTLLEQGQREVERAARYGRPLAAVMIDIDHFKMINDTYGHATGDRALVEVSARCQSALRSVDLLGRYGGDELVTLLPESDLPQAVAAAERLRELIARAPLGEVQATLSLGVAAMESGCSDVALLLADADRALYNAKRAGRNRVGVAGQEERSPPPPAL